MKKLQLSRHSGTMYKSSSAKSITTMTKSRVSVSGSGFKIGDVYLGPSSSGKLTSVKVVAKKKVNFKQNII